MGSIRDLLRYDPETGKLFWKVSRSTVKAGDEAGNIGNRGYRTVMVEGKNYLAHRLAFYLMEGYWPEFVDHINRDRLDNRWANLREATRSLNNSNRTPTFRVIENKYGHKGVRKAKDGRYNLIGRDDKYIARFKTLEEACAASEKYWESVKI